MSKIFLFDRPQLFIGVSLFGAECGWQTWLKHQTDFQRRRPRTPSDRPFPRLPAPRRLSGAGPMVQDLTPRCQPLLREDIVDKVPKRDMTAFYGVRRVLELEKIFLDLCYHDGGILDVPTLSKQLDGINRQSVNNSASSRPHPPARDRSAKSSMPGFSPSPRRSPASGFPIDPCGWERSCLIATVPTPATR